MKCIGNKLKLVLYPDDRLNQKCQEVNILDIPKYRYLAKDMYEFMIENNGIGLAANQVGENIRLIVVQHNNKPLYMFNPMVISSTRKQYKFEGCLSFPDELKKCKRGQLIKVKYYDLNGKMKLEEYKGLTARCVQHEVDHLNGITFLDREKKND